MSNSEKCTNPFKSEVCGDTDIVVYIKKDGNVHPACRKCWDEIADSDLEWGESSG